MGNKLTAVQFLIEHIKIDAMYEAKTIDEWVLVFDRAKQMEKEQIAEACKDKLSAADLLFDMEAEYEAKFKQQDNG
jgi:hypothetical protein